MVKKCFLLNFQDSSSSLPFFWDSLFFEASLSYCSISEVTKLYKFSSETERIISFDEQIISTSKIKSVEINSKMPSSNLKAIEKIKINK